jgi:hypothetical protein
MLDVIEQEVGDIAEGIRTGIAREQRSRVYWIVSFGPELEPLTDRKPVDGPVHALAVALQNMSGAVDEELAVPLAIRKTR